VQNSGMRFPFCNPYNSSEHHALTVTFMAGHTKVARFMAHHGEMGILRRFKDLNFKNLLYLQAELVELEKELEYLSGADSAAIGSPRASYEKHWPLLRESKSDGSGEQWAKFLQIRNTLDQYSTSPLDPHFSPARLACPVVRV
jgi:hypothetical protein